MEVWIQAFVQAHGPGQWALLFYVCCFAGWCWEVALYVVRQRRFVNRGFCAGPILPIYGFGALLILFVGLPIEDRPLLVAVAGMVFASLLEYATGEAMEAIFHVRYWDYSKNRFNLRGHICLLSAVTWAAMSYLVVCIVHPMIEPWLNCVPDRIALAAAGAMTVFAAVDVTLSVRRALDLRALLVSMERYAQDLEVLHENLGGVAERMGNMLRAFVAQLGLSSEELEERLRAIDTARERMIAGVKEKRMTMEEGAKERFAAFEQVLAEITADLPDVNALRGEIAEARDRYERQSEQLRTALYERRVRAAQRLLRRNPSASSKRHERPFERIAHPQDKQQ